MLQLQSNDKLS